VTFLSAFFVDGVRPLPFHIAVPANPINGIATLITSTLPAGTYQITDTYGGGTFSGSQAVLAPPQTVVKASTTTALHLSTLPPGLHSLAVAYSSSSDFNPGTVSTQAVVPYEVFLLSVER